MRPPFSWVGLSISDITLDSVVLTKDIIDVSIPLLCLATLISPIVVNHKACRELTTMSGVIWCAFNHNKDPFWKVSPTLSRRRSLLELVQTSARGGKLSGFLIKRSPRKDGILAEGKHNALIYTSWG